MFPPLPNPTVQATLATYGEQDLVRRSASNIPPPARELTKVAKLIDVTKCIGCKACQVACLEWNDMIEQIGVNHGVYDNPLDLTPDSFTVMRFTEWVNPETQNLEWLIRKDGCMHCADPGCLKACPTQAIVFGSKDDMKKWADMRIKDLKSRGFKNAGLYDPPGVSGTHVMYVLHHADKPEIYAGLPNNPRISPIVELWKGVAKYAGLAAIGGM